LGYKKHIFLKDKKIFSIFQGYAFSSKDSVAKGTRWIKIADVSIQRMNYNSESYLPNIYKEKYKKFILKKGDYVIALTRPILNKKLKIAPIDEKYDGALLNQRVGKLISFQNIKFVYFLLQTSKVINDIDKSISGSEPPNLSAQQIDNITTYIPTPKEQQKIANTLSTLDNLIEAQNQQINHLKQHKKGLMQQLFVSDEEK
jgi:type I restriction enzyme S subunit